MQNLYINPTKPFAIYNNSIINSKIIYHKNFIFYYLTINNQLILSHYKNLYKTISQPITLISPYKTFDNKHQLLSYINQTY